MQIMIDALIQNLTDVGWSMLIFICSYLSNMAFGIYHNVKQVGQAFSTTKILNSVYKVLSIVLGVTLLVVATTALPEFANYVGWQIPADYIDAFNSLAILGVGLYMSCKYIVEALNKFKQILSESKNESTENTAE